MNSLIERLKEQRRVNPPLFLSKKGERIIPLPQAVTLEELEGAETELGFRLPQLLRELYLRIGNGGFGPGGGILGITPGGWKDDAGDTTLDKYMYFASSPTRDETYIGLLPFCYYGPGRI